MTDLARLMELCKAEVIVWCNPHRGMYQTVAEWIDHETYRSDRGDDNDPPAEPEVCAQMIASDRVIVIHAYRDTPVGFFRVVHWDLAEAIRTAIKHCENEP